MEIHDLHQRIRALRSNARILACSSNEERNSLLLSMADHLRSSYPAIERANQEDIRSARESGQRQALVDRLVLTADKLEAAIQGIMDVTRLEDPIGHVKQRRLLDTGLLLEQVTVPIGVIGMIFEARPDALIQIVSLCLKSGNGIILKGGREAQRTNEVLVKVIKDSCENSLLGNAWLTLLESHGDVDQLLGMDGLIDLIIPRGSNQFVRYVMDHTNIPVLGHADGICHLYIDEVADLDNAVEICWDAKTQYPAACNAVETILVHHAIASKFLPMLKNRFSQGPVIIHGDETSCSLIEAIPYQEGDWKREYLCFEVNVRVVDSLGQAIEHINTYGSHHTDAIISENHTAVREFLTKIDSADVFANCSTRFSDGFRFGFGAEVGISTSRIHARGPVGLDGLMTTKYVVVGSGQVVSSYVGKDRKSFIHQNLSLEGASLLEGGLA